MALFPEMTGTAAFSPCRRYRYALSRTWARGEGTCLFVMLNPSTADAESFDPTVRRCAGYAADWGYARLLVANIFAYRATDPREMKAVEDPIGPENDRHIVEQAGDADLVLCAWGTHGAHLGRGEEVLRLLREAGVEPHALRVTKAGHPSHPLYLPARLRPFELA